MPSVRKIHRIPYPYAMKPQKDLSRVRQLVMQHGWNATSYQLLNPGIRHWFSPGGEAVIGYAAWRNVWIVAGAPVCAPENLAGAVTSFDRHAARHGKRVCYFGAGDRLKSFLDDCSGYSSVVLGAQPAWNPHDWPAIVRGHASLRSQLRRVRNKGIAVREWPVQQATGHPALRRLLRQWLKTRGLPAMHFLVEPQTLASLYDRRVFVAEWEGTPIGFLIAAPIPRRNGWLTEQFVRGVEAPNGTIDILMDAAIRTMAAEGAAYVTMGLVPLSRHSFETAGNPLWLDFTLRWIRAHGRRFYNFDGLEYFKSKFQPQSWELLWVMAREPSFTPATLLAVAGAFSRQPPLRFMLRGLLRAARQEYSWLSQPKKMIPRTPPD